MIALRTLVIAAGMSTWMGAARADGEGLLNKRMPAVVGGLEIASGGGYTRGVGDARDHMESVGDLASGGTGSTIKIGYRATPNLAVGAYGTGALYRDRYGVDGTTDVAGASAGLYLDWHLRPMHRVDPWLSIGAGWRALWALQDDGHHQALHGIEVARIEAGIDIRLSPRIAIAPVIAVSTTMFLSRHAPGMDGHESIDDSRDSVFVSAGLQSRFDAFGTWVQ